MKHTKILIAFAILSLLGSTAIAKESKCVSDAVKERTSPKTPEKIKENIRAAERERCEWEKRKPNK